MSTSFTKTPCSGCGKKVTVRQGKAIAVCRGCRADNRIKTCLGCGVEYEASPKWASRSKYCSHQCFTTHREIWNKKTQELVIYTGPKFQRKPRMNTNASAIRRQRCFKSVKCRQCGNMFLTLNVDLTCSDKCWKQNLRDQRRLNKDKRRAVKKQAFVESVSPKYIFKRDGYRCQLCKKMTDPTKTVPHPEAPTVDHIIPLDLGVERGGIHAKRNCHTAHFKCNCTKGNRGGGEQLLLIG